MHGKGRVFGCVLGHYAATFDDPFFRILLLRGMAWAAGESPYRWDRVSQVETAD
jgi:type 1 glutamine amidotransferase